ncbi:MAG TPA: DedA family protein [Methanocella sp.]|nr:DedA family protein [Methanocella sp.]
MVLFEFLSSYITDLICTFGYPGIVFLMTLESACLPVPSEIVLPFSGFAVQQGRLDFWAVGLAGSVGCLIGSVLSYAVGYYGGRPLLERYGRFILITRHEIDLAHRWFERHGPATVFIARLLPIVRTFVSLPAGIVRMDFKTFVVYSFVGSLPWCFALTYAGLWLKDQWGVLEQYWVYFDVLTVLGIIAFFLYVGYKLTKGHSGHRA